MLVLQDKSGVTGVQTEEATLENVSPMTPINAKPLETPASRMMVVSMKSRVSTPEGGTTDEFGTISKVDGTSDISAGPTPVKTLQSEDK